MSKKTLCRGDVFCVSDDSFFSKAIRAAELVWAQDNKAEFGHAGIITDQNGSTFEALWTTRAADMSRYDGCNVLVARPEKTTTGKLVSLEDKDLCLGHLTMKYVGDWYPVWRLALHLVPPLARLITFRGRHLVCSELVAKYLAELQTHSLAYTGINPDTLADMLRCHRPFRIIYEGTWQNSLIS